MNKAGKAVKRRVAPSSLASAVFTLFAALFLPAPSLQAFQVETSQSDISRAFPAQRERDEESGLLHFRARWYDPGSGRFGQNDPIRGNQPFEHYAYAQNNPALYLDPMGEDVTEQDLAEHNSALAAALVAMRAGNTTAYHSAYANLGAIDTRILAAQGDYEFLDTATARGLYNAYLGLPVKLGSSSPSADQLSSMIQQGNTAGGALEGQDKALRNAYWATWGLDKVGTAASFALGGGALINAAKVGGAKFAGVQVAKGLAYGVATSVGIESGGYALESAGVDEQTVQIIKSGVSAGVSLYNLARTYRSARLSKRNSIFANAARGNYKFLNGYDPNAENLMVYNARTGEFAFCTKYGMIHTQAVNAAGWVGDDEFIVGGYATFRNGKEQSRVNF